MAVSIAKPAAATAQKINSVRGRAGKPLSVYVLAYDGLSTLEYAIAVSVFAQAKPASELKSAGWYECHTIAMDETPVSGLGSLVVKASLDLTPLATADLIIIPGWPGMESDISENLNLALKAAYAQGARIGAMGAGVYVLAQCGLLEGRRATTHWRDIDAFQLRYPNVKVDTNVLFVEDENLLSSAGGMSGLDMCVHIVRGDYGTAMANVVARSLVKSSMQNTDSLNEVSRPHPRIFQSNIAPLLDKIREKIHEDWGIERMARESRSSARTLQRRFKDATGHSPHMWLTIERIEFAKDLLETTSMNIQQIAHATGLKTPETLRHHFKRVTGLSPTRFRTQFAQDEYNNAKTAQENV
ncbi:MAG: AraC family transcriptional regulator [Robiginitomaculum sp.]|nr:MAG: AraC family transcriptional regulator [Robiginitomaculum sp.]